MQNCNFSFLFQRGVFEFTHHIKQILRQIRIDLENVHVVGIRISADIRLDGYETVEFFLARRLAGFFAIQNAVIDQILEDVVEMRRIDLYAI